MQNFKLAVLIVGSVAILGCQQKAPVAEITPPVLGKVLPNLPLPPDPTALTRESSADATQMIFTTPVAVDSILTFYRDLLGKPPYRLINESTNGGITSFYVEQDGPSMWVAVQKNGTTGSMVTIAGAAVDTTKKAAPPADTTKPKPAS
jgi:hypothetical protein